MGLGEKWTNNWNGGNYNCTFLHCIILVNIRTLHTFHKCCIDTFIFSFGFDGYDGYDGLTDCRIVRFN